MRVFILEIAQPSGASNFPLSEIETWLFSSGTSLHFWTLVLWAAATFDRDFLPPSSGVKAQLLRGPVLIGYGRYPLRRHEISSSRVSA